MRGIKVLLELLMVLIYCQSEPCYADIELDNLMQGKE